MRPSSPYSTGVVTLLTLIVVAGVPTTGAADGPVAPVARAAVQETPRLASFGRLIGGEWHDGEGSWHEFEWGVRRRLVRSRSFFEIDGEPTLVAEGFWFWHPGRETIVGYTVAVEMPADLFEVATRFEDDRMINELVSYGAAGGRYQEVWEFTDDDHYTWTLYQITEAGQQQIMSARYERRR